MHGYGKCYVLGGRGAVCKARRKQGNGGRARYTHLIRRLLIFLRSPPVDANPPEPTASASGPGIYNVASRS
jgi:hypothetical protein